MKRWRNTMTNPRTRWWVSGVFGLWAWWVSIGNAFPVPPLDQGQLNHFIAERLARTAVVGLSYSLVTPQHTQMRGYFGYANIDAERKIAEDTVFQIASVSKTVTGTAVMQLVERDLIQLDVDVNAYLPFRIQNPLYPDVPITPRMLLDHTSSLADNWPIYDALYTIEQGGGDSPISLEEFLRGYFVPEGQWYDSTNNFTVSPPGRDFLYCNTAYGLLGYVVEQVSGQSFSEYCREHIFDPLGMHDAAWLVADTDLSKFATPYEKGEIPLPAYSFPTYPDGALRLSVGSYERFLAAIGSGGALDGVRILETRTVVEMLRRQSNRGKQALTWTYDAFAPFAQVRTETIGHTGGDPGIMTFAAFNLVSRSSLVIFVNSDVSLDDYASILNLVEILRVLVREAGV